MKMTLLKLLAAVLVIVATGLASLSINRATSKTGEDSTSSRLLKPKNYRTQHFETMVILGESTVEGGPWLAQPSQRFADILADLIGLCQGKPIVYYNKGIGANSISPRSPGYEKSRKPSAMERHNEDVIALKPDLFVLCYGLNDMRAGMPVGDFREDMATIIRNVKAACDPVIVLTTVYYMTGWRSYAPYDRANVESALAYNECIRGLAAEYDCIVADVWAAEGGADWLIDPDGVHANRVGNLVIAHRIFEALAQHASCLSKNSFEELAETSWRRKTTGMRSAAGDPFIKTW
jgi:lysophospholipase L1-like esterase